MFRRALLAALALSAGGGAALSQEVAELRLRGAGGVERTDVGSGWRLLIESDLWMHGENSPGFVGFGLRAATSFDRNGDIGRRRLIDGDLYLAPAYDIGDFRLFAAPSIGLESLTQLDYWNGEGYQGTFIHFALSIGVHYRWQRLELSLVGTGTYYIAETPTDPTLLTKPLFPGGWSFSLDFAVGYIAPL